MALQSHFSTLAVLGIGLAAVWSIAKAARPDLVVTVNDVPTETGEAWDPADLVLNSGYHSITKVNELEYVIEMDDGGHATVYHGSNPFLSVKQLNH